MVIMLSIESNMKNGFDMSSKDSSREREIAIDDDASYLLPQGNGYKQ